MWSSTLNLKSNLLTGTIPLDLSGITGLVYLYLSSNSLSGTIPSSLGTNRQLVYVTVRESVCVFLGPMLTLMLTTTYSLPVCGCL